jgi:hypothetical protein
VGEGDGAEGAPQGEAALSDLLADRVRDAMLGLDTASAAIATVSTATSMIGFCAP